MRLSSQRRAPITRESSAQRPWYEEAHPQYGAERREDMPLRLSEWLVRRRELIKQGCDTKQQNGQSSQHMPTPVWIGIDGRRGVTSHHDGGRPC